ncbi:MAG: TonB-dependent receptor [Acidobacteria bacterium]|nr:MAG: TonB-dependent receptor [Acidobacteriota bacterium]
MQHRCVLALWLCLFAFLAPLSAQTTTGSIVGTVTDPSGAVIAGATVTVTNMDTGIAVKTPSDSTGNYVATPLPVGRYSVTVEAAGFKKSVRSDITVNVQDRVRVDAALEVGAVTDTVEVAAAAPLLQTDTSYLGQVVGSQEIVDLPLNGRYFTRLAVLTAGTAPTPNGARDEKTGGFSSNGVRPYQNNYLLDGVDNNSLSEDLVSDQSFVIGPPPDAIAEFKVQTNSMSAEFGRSGGAVLNVTIKSGTNELHGTVYEFLRNSQLDAKNFFDDPTQPIPPFKLNQFGFSVGGPVIFPKAYNGKNRTFFFFDYQGTRVRTGHTFLASVPPTTWRNGDFSGFAPIFDPDSTVVAADGSVTRQPFANNQIPSGRFDPIAKKLLDEFPSPNVAGAVASSGVANNFLSSPSEPDDTNQLDLRIDHKISDSDSIFGRFSMSNQNLTPPSPIPPPLDGQAFTSGDFLNRPRNVVITETHIFTPRTVNELRLGYTRNRSERLQFNSDKNLSADLGLPGIPFGPKNGGLPAFCIDDLTCFGSSTYQPTVEVQNVYHIVDSLSLVRGKHTIKIGAEVKPRVNFTILQPPSPRGYFEFSGQFTRDPNDLTNTGLGTADFLLGRMSTAQVASFIDDTFQQPAFFLYVQDDFKVNRKLTLNLGLRYDGVAATKEKYGAQASFNLATKTLDIVKGRNDPLPANFYPEIAVNRNAPPGLVPTDRNNFGPRVGFAYNATPKTVIRGGYGIFYSAYEAGPLSIPNPGNNPPFYEQATYNAISLTVPNPKVNQLSKGLPLDALVLPDKPQLFALDPGFRNPYVQHFNLSVQRELGWNTVWEIAYAGSKGSKLYEFRNANQASPTVDPNSPIDPRRPFPFLEYFPNWCSCSSSTYHSLQTKAEKRFSSGLSFLAAYTWGRSIDEASQASLGFHDGGSFRYTAHPDWEKSRSDFDIAHRFVLSYTYELPFGKGKRFASGVSRLGDTIIGGWSILGINAFQTGTPRTITANVGVSNSDGEDRPDRVTGIPVYPSNQDPTNWFNKDAFTTPAAGTFGNSGRNIIDAPGLRSVDLSIFKDFKVYERAKLSSSIFLITRTSAATAWTSIMTPRAADRSPRPFRRARSSLRSS